MRKKLLIVVAIACIIGAAVSLLSTSQYFRIRETGLEQQSFCVVNEYIDCDAATASSYATFFNIPVAWFGFLAYLVMGGIALIAALSKTDRRATVTAGWILSLLSILYSIRMAYILFFVSLRTLPNRPAGIIIITMIITP